LLGLLAVVERLGESRLAETVGEEGQRCPREKRLPPVPERRRLPPTNRKRLLWLMSQLLERQLAQSTAVEEKSDESE
jgi:hypothetical protein